MAAAGFTEALTFALVYYIDFMFFLVECWNSNAAKTAEDGLSCCINVPVLSITVLAGDCLLVLWNYSIIFCEFVRQKLNESLLMWHVVLSIEAKVAAQVLFLV